MPNWKKIVVSGSDALLNSVTSSFTGSLTGTLIGTASWAQSASQALTASRAISSSYALSASYAPGGATFPYVGNAVITGSFIVSGSSGKIQLSGSSGILWDSNGNKSVEWSGGGRYLWNLTNTATTVQWEDLLLKDNSNNLSVDWGVRALYDNTGTDASIDWNQRLIITPSGASALAYSNEIITISELYNQRTIGTSVQQDLTDNIIYAGQLIGGTVSGSVTHDLIRLDTDGVWRPASASIAGGADKMLGIITGKGLILIEGDAPVSDDGSHGAYVIGASHGLPVYMSTTSGVMDITPPSGTGEVVRVVGHIYYQSGTDENWWVMKFRPSNDWYEI